VALQQAKVLRPPLQRNVHRVFSDEVGGGPGVRGIEHEPLDFKPVLFARQKSTLDDLDVLGVGIRWKRHPVLLIESRSWRHLYHTCRCVVAFVGAVALPDRWAG
jgi:hypothetical protein